MSQITWDGNVPLWAHSGFLMHNTQNTEHSLMLVFVLVTTVEDLTSNHLQ